MDNLYFVNYYLKESSEVFLLKYLKYTKLPFLSIFPQNKNKKQGQKKSTKKQLVKKKHKKAHVLLKSTLYEHCHAVGNHY